MKESTNKPGQAKNSKQPESTKQPEVVATKNGAGKGIWILSSLIGVLILLGGFLYIYLSHRNSDTVSLMEAQNNELTRQINEHDSLVNDWIISMGRIEDDLRALQGKEANLIEQSEDPEITPDIRESIYAEIENINQLLEQNREKIRQLNAKLKKSNVQIASLNKQIKELEITLAERDSSLIVLKNTLSEKEFKLAELNTVVDSLHKDISGYREDIRSYEIQVDLQNDELNKAYIAMGSPRELEDQGVIKKEGGFLGLGRNTSITPDLPEEPFNRVKISDTRRIELNAKKAKLISDHPSESYEMVRNDSLVAYIEITDPIEFWKITRYAVVETKK